MLSSHVITSSHVDRHAVLHHRGPGTPILGFDDFQVLLTIPNHGWSIERHDWVATSGTIKVIDKKGSGDNLTFTLMLNNVEFTTSRVIYARRHTRQDDSVYCTINGVIRFEYTNRYNN